MRFHVGDVHSVPPPKRLGSPIRMNCPVSTQIFTLEKAAQSGLRMHIMLHGVNGGSHRVPLGKCSMSLPDTTASQACPTTVEIVCFLFFFLPSGSWRHPLWCSVWGLRAGGLTKEEQGRWRNESSPSWKEVASVFVLIDLTTAESTYFYLTGSFFLLDWASKRDRNVSCWENPSVKPWLFKKENGSYNHVISHNGSELLKKKKDGDCGQSIIPRAN